MAWRMTGTYYAPCSCEVGCPCELGELEGDQGWCSGSLAFDIRSGNVDGEDIGGTRVVLVGDWPSGFLGGKGTGRLYFDRSVPQAKRAAMEKMLQGKMGGVWEPGEGATIAGQLWIQTKSVLFTIVYTGVLSFIILKVVDLVVGLRVTPEQEEEGLDLSLHNERGYNI